MEAEGSEGETACREGIDKVAHVRERRPAEARHRHLGADSRCRKVVPVSPVLQTPPAPDRTPARHLQQNHPELGFVLLDLSQHGRKLAEEKIGDEIASHLLMPLDDGGPDEVVRHPAEVMAGLFASTSASRSAVLRKVVSLLPGSAKWILAVADVAGVVEHAGSTYSDAQPARGSTQPGLAALAAEAVSGPVRRKFHEGLRYSTGSELHSMMAEAVLDMDGRYVFVALTPEARFGTGEIVWPIFECANAACGRSFEPKWVRRHCDKCGDPACSWCDRCSCDPTNTGVVCDRCFMPWAPAEVDAGRHEF